MAENEKPVISEKNVNRLLKAFAECNGDEVGTALSILCIHQVAMINQMTSNIILNEIMKSYEEHNHND